MIFHYIRNQKIKVVKLALEKGLMNKREAIILINLIKFKKLKCELCSKTFGKHSKKTVDHIIPKSRGGNGDLDNLQLAHYGYNNRKGDK